MTDEPSENSLQPPDSTAVYKDALNRVWTELEAIKEMKKNLGLREAMLNDTLRALLPLVGTWMTDISDYSLSNAVRFIFNGLAPDRSLTPIEVRAKLEELGYNLGEHENALASIHTCMRRMTETEELILVTTEDKKKKFEPGPELKSVPEPEGRIATLKDLLGAQREEK
jgi:hypothetical protein